MRRPTQLSSRARLKTSSGQRLRVFERAIVAGQVFIHDEEHLFIAPLNNISAGGLFIDQLVSIPAGHVVRIVVKSSRLEHPIQAKGTVIRVEDSKRRGIAIEFTSISSRSRELIQNCVFESRMEGALKAA